MIELLLASAALARPNVCVFPPPPAMAECSPPPAGPPPVPPSQSAGKTNGNAGAQAPARATVTGPMRIRAGSVAHFVASPVEEVHLCSSLGSSLVGCASSGTDRFHLRVRRGRVQIVSARLGGVTYSRLVYVNGRLMTKTG